MKQPKWNEYEAVLLVDMYFKIKENGIDRKTAVSELSNTLRQMAINGGLEIDDVYRNENGINMRLYELDGILTNGQYGIKSTSDLFRKTIWLYQNINSSFQIVLDEAKAYINSFNTIDDTEDSESYIDEELTLAELYHIDLDGFDDSSIKEEEFSVRTFNGIKRANINTLKELFSLTIKKIESIRNIGQKSVKEILVFASCFNSSALENTQKEVKSNSAEFIKDFRDQIKVGDFSFKSNFDSDSDNLKLIEKYEKYYDLLGKELVVACVDYPKSVIPVMIALNGFYKNKCKTKQRATKIYELINNIPPERIENLSVGYMNAYSKTDEIRRALMECYSIDATLKDISIDVATTDKEIFDTMCDFLSWCSFDIDLDISRAFENLYSHMKNTDVLKLRSTGITLQEAGDKLGVTRERVRQIEAKAVRTFSKYEQKYSLLLKISALRNNDTVLTVDELKQYFGDWTDEAVLLLRGFESSVYRYDKSLNVFIIGNSDSTREIDNYIDSMPDFFLEKRLDEFLNDATENMHFNAELFLKQVNRSYSKTGKAYHKYRLKLSDVYRYIVQEFYADEIKVYDEDVLEEFRNHIYNEFGDLQLPEQNRAISARLSEICMLCGKGTYKLKQEKYISDELLKKIHSYIVDSEEIVFLTNTLYAVFQNELEAEGVNNKYYLQGILKEAYGSEFFFRRDLISKDENTTSVYSQIVDFIKECGNPVVKERIIQRFPGITEIVINFAIQDPNVLNYFGEYVHIDNLDFHNDDKEYLELNLIERLIDNPVLHSKDLYDAVKQNNPGLLGRLKIAYPYCLFSLMESLFRDEYVFQRPYIACHGTEINKANDIIAEYISNVDLGDINDLMEYTKEIHYTVYSILEFLNSFNESVFILDYNRIASHDYIGIDKSICGLIETALENEVNSTIEIRNLIAIYNLPSINVEWTDWLIYSIINKWSDKYDVGTTSNQFRLSVPVIAPKGKLNLDDIEITNSYQSLFAVKVDDLDDLDSLEFDLFEEDY